jgi:probable HAF family extracellular repeat protein
MRIIEIPANATQSQTTGMNDAAQIVGSVVLYQNGRYVWRAFVASQAEGMHLLGTLGGDYVSAATDINNDGEVVGVSTTAEGGYFSFIWDPVRGMRNIYPQGESGPRALNEMGQALCVTNNTNTPRSFIWEKTRGVTFISQAGENFDAADINNNSEAIGTLYAWSGNERLALWNSAQGIRQVGSLSSQYPRTFGVALNDKGQAVGHAFPPSARTGEERAFLWDSAKGIRNLNDLIPPSSGWVLLRAVDINEAGQIVGTGLYNGWPRTFVLTPPIRFLPRQRLFSPAPEALITGLSAGCRLCSVPATGAMLARWRSTIGSMAPLLSSIQLLLTC